MAVTFSTANWNKKTPGFWQWTGIVCLILIPVTDFILSQSNLPIEVKPWVILSKDILLVISKFTTKLFHDDGAKTE